MKQPLHCAAGSVDSFEALWKENYVFHVLMALQQQMQLLHLILESLPDSAAARNEGIFTSTNSGRRARNTSSGAFKQLHAASSGRSLAKCPSGFFSWGVYLLGFSPSRFSWDSFHSICNRCLCCCYITLAFPSGDQWRFIILSHNIAAFAACLQCYIRCRAHI